MKQRLARTFGCLFAASAIGTTHASGQVPDGKQPAPPAGVTIGPEGPVLPKTASGQPGAPESNTPQVYKLSITPVAEPMPPLKYRFSVSSEEREPGNSVPFYYRALVQLGQRSAEARTQFDDAVTKYSDLTASELPRDEIRALLSTYENVFGELDRAALREETDWDWRLEELGGVESINFLLPEIQESRQLARLLKFKAQLELAEGRYDDAARTLRNGYALAQAVAEPPTIINDLVGVAIASVMDAVVREWAGTPGSPNLYWAITSLPAPLIDLRPALEYELALPNRFAPWLENAEADEVPPEVWRDRFAGTLGDLQEMEPLMKLSATREPKEGSIAGVAVAALAIRNYPSAKAALVGRGYDPLRVEAMPVGQVLAIQQKFVSDVIAQELLKETFLPPAAAREVGAAAEQSLKDRGYFGRYGYWQGGETVPLMAILAPATRQAARAGWRLETYLAGLRAIEAIRMHAAATGSLPKALDEIKLVPVPENPTTGEPFGYALEGETATLEIVPEAEQPRVTWRVEMRLKK